MVPNTLIMSRGLMTNKFNYLLILLTIVIISFPSICFSELKTVEGEYCEIYLGDMQNKKELGEIRKSVSEKSITDGLRKINNIDKDVYFSEDCLSHIISQYLGKVVVVSHTEKGRKICEKVKITLDPEVTKKYLAFTF